MISKKVILADFELRVILCALYDRRIELMKRVGYIRATGNGLCDEQHFLDEIALNEQLVERLRLKEVSSK